MHTQLQLKVFSRLHVVVKDFGIHCFSSGHFGIVFKKKLTFVISFLKH